MQVSATHPLVLGHHTPDVLQEGVICGSGCVVQFKHHPYHSGAAARAVWVHCSTSCIAGRVGNRQGQAHVRCWVRHTPAMHQHAQDGSAYGDAASVLMLHLHSAASKTKPCLAIGRIPALLHVPQLLHSAQCCRLCTCNAVTRPLGHCHVQIASLLHSCSFGTHLTAHPGTPNSQCGAPAHTPCLHAHSTTAWLCYAGLSFTSVLSTHMQCHTAMSLLAAHLQ
jgi:hypothetical protein